MSNIQKDITTLAIADTVEYIKSLRISETIATQVNRYLNFHKKGIRVGFGFGSNGIKSSFDHFTTRYRLKNVSTDFIDPKEKTPSSGRYHYMNKEGNLKREENQIQRELKDFNAAIKSTDGLHHSLPENYKDSNEYEIVKSTLNDIVEYERSHYKKRIEQKQQNLKTLTNLSRLQRNLSDNISNYHNMYQKLIAKFYFERVNHYLQEVFPNSKIVIKYKDYNWFDNDRRLSISDEQYIDGFSMYEDSLYNWVRSNELNFRLEVIKGDFKLFLNRGSGGVSRNKYPDKTEGNPTIEQVNEKFDKFFEENPTFFLLLKTCQIVKSKVEKSITHDHVMSFLFKSSTALIEEYNQLVEERNNAVNEIPEPEKIEVPTIEELFPQVTVVREEVEDFLSTHFGLDEKTKIIIRQLGNKDYVLTQKRVKEESLI